MTAQKNRFVDPRKCKLSGLARVKDHQQALNQFLGEVDRDAVRASVADTSGAIVPHLLLAFRPLVPMMAFLLLGIVCLFVLF